MVNDKEGQPLPPQAFEAQLDWIVQDAEEHFGTISTFPSMHCVYVCKLHFECSLTYSYACHIEMDFSAMSKDEYSEEARSLAALTGIDRSEWAKARTEYFSSGINKDSLHLLDSAIFHVSVMHAGRCVRLL